MFIKIVFAIILALSTTENSRPTAREKIVLDGTSTVYVRIVEE